MPSIRIYNSETGKLQQYNGVTCFLGFGTQISEQQHDLLNFYFNISLTFFIYADCYKFLLFSVLWRLLSGSV